MRVRFGDCEVDTDTRELIRSGRPVHVSPRAFELLQVLLEKRPRALSKTELNEKLWPRTFVSDSALAGLVKEVRAALGDDARRPRYLRTLPAFGYAFCGDAAEVAPPRTRRTEVSYRLLWKGRDVTLTEGETVFGRGPDSAVWIDDESVSRRHARLRIAGGGVRLEDLGSRNGTFVNGRRIKTAELSDKDEIRLGSVTLTLRILAGVGTTHADGSR
jgi:DNA-binding winged helix-turn-helix (wHTH) protein